MKTLKKLFSVSAIVALLGTLFPMHALAANYSDELQEAYAYALSNGITTMKTIDAADMYGSLTRVAMAKMIANYATTVLWLEPDTSAKCTFTDVTAALDAQYDNWVTKACQLGLMGQNITAFRPNDLVTRAEFGTTLSRALNHDSDDLEAMNAANPYYKDHLNFLKAEGIMNQIDNPSMTEVRGYVMLMMMRADKTPNEKCSPEEMVACVREDDIAACLAACTGEEKPENPEEPVGNAVVTVKKVWSSSTVEVPVYAINVKVWTVKFTAGDEDAKVSSVELTKEGLWYFDTDELQVALRNDNLETEFASVKTSSDKVKVKFSPALTIKAGKSETFDIIVNATAGVQNATYTFKLTDVVVSNWKVEWTPISLWTLKTTSSEPKTVDVSIDNGSATVKAWDTEKTIAKVNVNFDKAAWTLNRISLMNIAPVETGNPDTDKLWEAFANINAYVDGKKVWKVNVTDEKIVISNLNISKAKDEEVSVELKADIIYNDEEASFAFYVDSIDIIQEWYDFWLVPAARVASTPTLIEQDKDVVVAWNNITFKKVSMDTKEYLPWTKNITVFDATFKSAIDVRIDTVKIEWTSELTDAILSADSAKLVINGEDFEIRDGDLTGATVNRTLPYTANSSLKADVDANKEIHIKVVLSTKKPLTADPIVDADVSLKLTVSWHALDNINNVFGTTAVGWDTVTIKEWTAVVAAATVAWPATRSLFPNKEQEVGRFSIEADGDSLTIDVLTWTYTSSTGDDAIVDLFEWNVSLVNAETEEEIAADFDWDTAWEFKISNIKNLSIAKDETLNLKLMASLSTISEVYGDKVHFTVKGIEAKTSTRTLKLSGNTDLSTDYTFRIVAPELDLTKTNEKQFKLVIRNTDKDVNIDVDTLRYRVVTTVADSDFSGNVCLTDDPSLIECPAGHTFGARGNELTTGAPILTGGITINKKSTATYYIVVDGTSIEPAVLRAEISALNYAEEWETTEKENYNKSAQ